MASSSKAEIRAVIFDIGGVIMRSPMFGIAAYEREKGLPEGFINVSIKRAGSRGAWGRFERGSITADEFGTIFEAELRQEENLRYYEGYAAKKGLAKPSWDGLSLLSGAVSCCCRRCRRVVSSVSSTAD